MNADPDDARLDDWIDRHLADFTDAVNEALDIEAGLRDARLPDRARSLDTTLDLDIDAGLQAIVARDSVPQEPAPPVGSESTGTPAPLELFANDLMRRPLHERLALRSHLPGKELRLIRGLAEACAANNAVTRNRGNDNEAASVLASAINHALDLAHDSDLDPLLARRLVNELVHARILADGLARHRDRAVELAQGLGVHVNRALKYVLDRFLDNSTQRLGNSSLAGFILELNGAFQRHRRRGKFGDLAAGVKALELVVADFTNADLADQDLRGVDLRGVRWSLLTTRWPPGWADPMREASTQVDPDQHPDLYEVRDDPRIRHTVQ